MEACEHVKCKRVIVLWIPNDRLGIGAGTGCRKTRVWLLVVCALWHASYHCCQS